MPGEIITIQAGNFANYVGAHFWNIQEELLGLAELEDTAALARQIDANVLFREGETSRGIPTCTPRTVIFDLSGSLGGASTHPGGADISTAPAVTSWSGPVAVHAAPRARRSRFVRALEEEPEPATVPDTDGAPDVDAAFQEALEAAARELDREGGIASWTDFLKAQLAPASVRLLPGLWQGVADFSGFGAASGVLSREEAREEALNQIRLFAEECDHLQGFQHFAEDLAGWGHFSWELLQALRDDYARTPLLLWALRSPPARQPSQEEARRKRLSEAVSLARLSEVADLYMPLQPPTHLPGIRWQPGNAFHASALCACVLDSATLPFRLARDPPASPLGAPLGAADMHSLAQLLASGSRANNLTAAFASLPCPGLPEGHAAAQAADARAAAHNGTAGAAAAPFTESVLSWTPGIPAGVEERLAESVVLRGPRRRGRPVRFDEAAELLDAALLQEGTRCVRHRCVVPQPLPLPLPFPGIFAAQQQAPNGHLSQQLQSDGAASSSAHASDRGAQLSSVSVLTRLCASPAAGDVARSQLQAFEGLARSGPGRAVLQGWGYSQDDVAEVEERLQAMAGAFDQDDM